MFSIGFATALLYIVFENIIDPNKLVKLDITNASSQTIKEVLIKATDGSGDYYGSVIYYNLKQNDQVLLPIFFNRDGSLVIKYTMENNSTFKSHYHYVMVGDIRKDIVTDKGIIPDKLGLVPNKNEETNTNP